MAGAHRGNLIFLSTFQRRGRYDNRALIRAIRDARRQGRGVKLHDWSVAVDAVDSVSAVAASLLDWCKDTLAGCRRPYGVDQFDLAIAYRGEGQVRNLTFERLRVIELYEDGLAHQVTAALRREIAGLPAALHLTAGLFSWGEALHAAMEDKHQRQR
jgi:hypothetical protein